MPAASGPRLLSSIILARLCAADNWNWKKNMYFFPLSFDSYLFSFFFLFFKGCRIKLETTIERAKNWQFSGNNGLNENKGNNIVAKVHIHVYWNSKSHLIELNGIKGTEERNSFEWIFYHDSVNRIFKLCFLLVFHAGCISWQLTERKVVGEFTPSIFYTSFANILELLHAPSNSFQVLSVIIAIVVSRYSGNKISKYFARYIRTYMFRTMNVQILSRATATRQDFVRSSRETSNLWQQRSSLEDNNIWLLGRDDRKLRFKCRLVEQGEWEIYDLNR